MKEQIKAKLDEDGVSPVIGVILMVAVTVALVALVTVIVFDIGGDVSESPDATVDIETDGQNAQVTATVLRNENVDKFYVNDTSNTATNETISDASAGDTAVLGDDGNDLTTVSGGATVQVVAEMSDGSRQVLTSTDYDFS